MRKIFIILFIILIPFSLAAQSQPACVIIYAEGEGFTVVSGGDEYYFDLYEEDVIGLELKKDDMLFTEGDTLLEIQVASSNNIIKVSENSSLMIDDFEEKGGGAFALSYGKIRAKVQKLTGTQQFKIDGKSAVCGVRGTDFGYDIVADPLGVEEDLITRIYCFEGSVEVEKKEEMILETEGEVEEVPADTAASESGPSAEAAAPSKIVITAEEMVALSTREPEKEMVSEKISEEITAYWGMHEFKTEPLTIFTMKDLDKIKEERRIREKNKIFWGSMSLIFAGTALELTTFFMNEYAPPSTDDLQQVFKMSGFVLLFGGAGGLVRYGSY